jgi:hypothetical protein
MDGSRMTKNKRITSMVAMAVVVATGLAVLLMLFPLTVDDSTIDVTGAVSGQICDFNLEIHNKSLFEIRLLGAHETCGWGGCITAPGVPCQIAPMSSKLVAIQFDPKVPLDSEDVEVQRDLTIYTDSKFQPKLMITFAGRVSK